MGRTDPALRLEENTNVYREEIARIHKSFPHSDLNFLVKIVGAPSEGERLCDLSRVTVVSPQSWRGITNCCSGTNSSERGDSVAQGGVWLALKALPNPARAERSGSSVGSRSYVPSKKNKLESKAEPAAGTHATPGSAWEGVWKAQRHWNFHQVDKNIGDENKSVT